MLTTVRPPNTAGRGSAGSCLRVAPTRATTNESWRMIDDSALRITDASGEVPPETLATGIGYAANLARAWKAAGLALIHLELGGYARAAARELTLAGILPAVSSLGMSLSEFRELAPGAMALDETAIALAAAHGLDRICIHADAWALAATRRSPSVTDWPAKENAIVQSGLSSTQSR